MFALQWRSLQSERFLLQQKCEFDKWPWLHYCKFTVSRLYKIISEFHSLFDCMLNRTSLFYHKNTVKQFHKTISDFQHYRHFFRTQKIQLNTLRKTRTVCCSRSRGAFIQLHFSRINLLRNRIVRNNRIVRLNGPVDEKNHGG